MKPPRAPVLPIVTQGLESNGLTKIMQDCKIRKTVSYCLIITMSFESQSVERKELAILKILSDSTEALGARVIANRLKEYGFELGERAVRYHLRLMDERGLTYLMGQRDGRVLTDKGMEEVRSALVQDKVGFAISRIENLSFRTTFNPAKCSGLLPVNLSLFNREDFKRALKAMKPAFENGYCTSDLVAVASENKQLGGITIPPGKMGLATVCSIIYNGALLKAGVPMESRFSGILQVRNEQPLRFAELIDYSGCSLDPSDIFIKARMTSVGDAARNGEGKILAGFREIPAICRSTAAEVIAELKEAGFSGLVTIGNTSEPVCEMPVGLNKMGMILLGGLNPIAAAEEAGTGADNMGMSTVMEYEDMVKFQDAVNDYRDLERFWEVSV
jgi:repressor of nif and glnA expression